MESGILSFLFIPNSWLKVKRNVCITGNKWAWPKFLNFDFSSDVLEEEYLYFTDYLQSAQLNKLGDTNTGVPGRLLGSSEICLEAGAGKYILETIDRGYKLMFIDNVPPPFVSSQK